MNSLTESASSIVKEVGPGGTLERILNSYKFDLEIEQEELSSWRIYTIAKVDQKKLCRNSIRISASSKQMHLVMIQVRDSRNLFQKYICWCPERQRTETSNSDAETKYYGRCLQRSHWIESHWRLLDSISRNKSSEAQVPTVGSEFGGSIGDSEGNRTTNTTGWEQTKAEIEEFIKTPNAAMKEMRQITKSLRQA